jgi:hypothetical protein
MAYGCLGIRLTLVMCLMLDIKLTLYQNFIYMVSYNRENSFQSYIIQQKANNNTKYNVKQEYEGMLAGKRMGHVPTANIRKHKPWKT